MLFVINKIRKNDALILRKLPEELPEMGLFQLNHLYFIRSTISQQQKVYSNNDEF
jgi:hypothetical protein